MDLNQIAIFVRVVDAGSMTRAARLLKLPKSRVSRNVAALEREIGATLLYRTTRQFSTTETGRAFYERCRQQIYDLEGAAGAVQEVSREVAGVLRLTAPEDVGVMLLGPILTEVCSLHPKLAVDLHLSNAVVDLVKEGMDVAIRMGDLDDAALKARRVGGTAAILVASPAFLKSIPGVRKLQDLEKYPALHFQSGDVDSEWLLRAKGRREERVRPAVRYAVNNARVLLELAVAGLGIALIPEFVCVNALATGKLKRLLPEYETLPTPMYLVWPPQRETSPKTRAFIEFAVSRLPRYFPK